MRKRFLLLLALATALLLAAGTAAASEDVAPDGHIHRAWCDAPGVCAICNEPYSGANTQHHGGNYQYDEQEHWQVCTGCNTEIPWSRVQHAAYCDNPGICCECGQPFEGGSIRHRFGEAQYNETQHWYICEGCGAEFFRGDHYAECGNEGVCGDCGQPYFGDNITHVGKLEYNDTEHWRACTRCGEITSRGRHYSFCDNPYECNYCNQPYAGDNVLHATDSTWQYNDTEHWQICRDCQQEVDREEHWAYCDSPGVCGDCGQPYSGSNIGHYRDYDSTYQHDETNHWSVCPVCKEKYNVEAHKFGDDGVCTVCEYSRPTATDAPTEEPTEAPTEKPTEEPTATPTVEPTEKPTEKPTEVPTEVPTAVPTEKPTEVPTEVPTEKPTEAPTEVPTEKPTEAPTEAPTEKPTEAPTEAPTEKPTEAPTEVPTEKPTEAPTEVPTEKPTEAPTEAPTEKPTEAPTEAPTEKPTEVPTEVPTEAPTEVPTEVPTTAPTEVPTAAPTAEPTQAPHEHVFRTFVSRGDGTHRSDCEGCGTFTVENCLMQSRTVNGVSCQVCSACGYTVVSALPAIELPEAPVAEAAAVTEAGEEASILVFDVTASLPEDSAFALCLQVMPQDGPALPGSVRITIPCTLDTANLRLVFIPEDGLPVEVPFEVIDGMLTFTADAPGVFALVPVQE